MSEKAAETGTTSMTVIVSADGRAEHPCWCGETHRGEYAFEDWAHHNCTHRDPLMQLVTGVVVCPLCGRVFSFEGGAA